MEFSGFIYTVDAEVSFTPEEAKLLVSLAKNHYDGTCRAAGLAINDGASENGFIAQLVLFASITPVKWSWRKLDLTMKILEQRGYSSMPEADFNLAMKLAKDIRDTMHKISDEHDRLTVMTGA